MATNTKDATGLLVREPIGPPIVEGADYVYVASIPAGCAGHLYRLHRTVIDVPSYQRKCLVEALTGKDQGELFVCTLHNFAIRYKLAEKQPTRG